MALFQRAFNLQFANSSVNVSNALVSVSIISGMIALSCPIAQAGPGDVNSINNGRDVVSGTYFNTPGSRTTFQNNNGGLWVHSGSLVRGLESSIGKTPTGNGGTLYFRAPGNVVRFDGNVDVSAIRNGALYTGNGGKVFVDAGYIFQNGNIFANGVNGGVVQYNVGGLTMGGNAKITAQGFGGDGGAVAINSTGTVDIRPGALIDTSGKVLGTFDTNVINVEGSVVNNQGILRANGLATTDFKGNNGDAAVIKANPSLKTKSVPGPIFLGHGTGDTATMQNILFETPGSADFRGGTVRLVAGGQNNPTNTSINAADAQLLNGSEKNALNTRNNQLVQNNQGDVLNRNLIQANGGFGKNGGTVILASARRVVNTGNIQANGANSINGIFNANGDGGNGGNGGTISVAALSGIQTSGLIQANGGTGAQSRSVSVRTGNGADANAIVTGTAGTGGDGGLIAFSGNVTNSGNTRANGGVGGAGGNASAADTETATATNHSPVARANAIAGKGGVGGQGGLVVFSGSSNPNGGGTVLANGGQGGKGGNAFADAHSFSNTGIPTANSFARKGAGGNSGGPGSVLAVNPLTFRFTQNFSTKAGGLGNSGSSLFRATTTRNGINVTRTSSSPVIFGSALFGVNRGIIGARKNEYLRHEDTAILLSQSGGGGNQISTLSGRLNDSFIRTVRNFAGTSGSGGKALADAETAGNLIVGSSTNGLALNNDLVNSNINPLFFNLNNLTLVNNGSISNNTLWTPGVHVVGAGFHDIWFSLGGGHISWLANGSITNNQIVMTRGLWSGGSTHLAATQDIINNRDFINIGPNKALLEGFSISGPLYESSHSGSLIFKAGRDITNSSTGKLESNLIFFDIHPPLNQNPPIDWPKFLNGAQIGATVNLLAGRNLNNAGIIRAEALTYRNGVLGAQNPALTQGGIIIGRHRTGSFNNTGSITATGNAFFSPNEADGPRFSRNTFPATTSFNGNIDIR